MTFSSEANQATYPFSLPNLPYDKSDLLPHMSAETFDYHHAKHHNAYVVNLNKLLETNIDLSSKTLEEIILASHNQPNLAGVFNNSAQVWNHTFFWHSMKKNGGDKPSGKVLEYIERDFGSYDKFVEEFKQAGATQFGSGWAWLVQDGAKLKVVKTANAEVPLTSGVQPLMCCDVWEHAYYIDYRNRRPDFIAAFLEHLVNWDFVEKNLK